MALNDGRKGSLFDEDERRRDELVREKGGVVLNDLNRFDYVDRNHANRGGDLRDHGRGRGFTNPPMPPGQW